MRARELGATTGRRYHVRGQGASDFARRTFHHDATFRFGANLAH